MTRRAPGEGSLRKRKNGSGKTVWEWRPPKTCPVQRGLYAKTREKVLEKRDEFLREIGAGVTQDASRITVSDFLATWLKDSVRTSVRNATLVHHERICRNHVEPRLGTLKLREVTGAHVAALYAEKLDAGYSEGTRRHIKTTLNKALKQAVRWGYLAKNPAEGVPVPKGPERDEEEGFDCRDARAVRRGGRSLTQGVSRRPLRGPLLARPRHRHAPGRDAGAAVEERGLEPGRRAHPTYPRHSEGRLRVRPAEDREIPTRRRAPGRDHSGPQRPP